MKSCSDGDKPCMPKKGNGGLTDKAPMKKGGGKKSGGEKLGHAIHHKNMPHGMTGPASPEGYCK